MAAERASRPYLISRAVRSKTTETDDVSIEDRDTVKMLGKGSDDASLNHVSFSLKKPRKITNENDPQVDFGQRNEQWYRPGQPNSQARIVRHSIIAALIATTFINRSAQIRNPVILGPIKPTKHPNESYKKM